MIDGYELGPAALREAYEAIGEEANVPHHAVGFGPVHKGPVEGCPECRNLPVIGATGVDWAALEPFNAAKERAIELFERAYVSDLVIRSRGNMAAAARMAGMDRSTLYRVMDRLGISPTALLAQLRRER